MYNLRPEHMNVTESRGERSNALKEMVKGHIFYFIYQDKELQKNLT